METLRKEMKSRFCAHGERRPAGEEGFTLIELLVVVAIIGILVGLGLQGFTLYKASAAYAAANSTLRSAQSAVAAGETNPDLVLPVIPLQVQSGAPGALSHPDGRRLMPGMQLPRSVTFRYRFDPTCVNPADIQAVVQVNHCAGTHFARWTRFCDGFDVVSKLPGAGCLP